MENSEYSNHFNTEDNHWWFIGQRKILTNVFENEREYAYLKNVLDTEKLGFKEIHVKVFELDYTKFHELNSKND